MGALLQCLTNPGRSKRTPPPSVSTTSPSTICYSFVDMVLLCFKYMSQTWPSNRPGESSTVICIAPPLFQVDQTSIGLKKKTLHDENLRRTSQMSLGSSSMYTYTLLGPARQEKAIASDDPKNASETCMTAVWPLLLLLVTTQATTLTTSS